MNIVSAVYWGNDNPLNLMAGSATFDLTMANLTHPV